MARFLRWLIGRRVAETAPVHTVSRPPCTPGRRRPRPVRRPLAGTALPRFPHNRSTGR